MKELAADGIAVAVTCRVLKLARQPYYRWLADPVTDACQICQTFARFQTIEIGTCLDVMSVTDQLNQPSVVGQVSANSHDFELVNRRAVECFTRRTHFERLTIQKHSQLVGCGIRNPWPPGAGRREHGDACQQ